MGEDASASAVAAVPAVAPATSAAAATGAAAAVAAGFRGASGAARTKPRPPALDLKKAERWPQLAVSADSALAAAAALAERQPSQLRVLTWNVWFDEFYGPLRQLALVRELLAAAPDVACLQEVVPAFANVIRQSAELTTVYDVSPQDVAPYGCLMLVRKDFRPQFGLQALPTRMGRSLLFAVCGERCPGLLLATVHLESLSNQPMRRDQLKHTVVLLRKHRASVLCGDFNFDDAQTWGDWRLSRPQFPRDRLENHVLQEVLPSFCDAWRVVHPDLPGKTFDGDANPLCVHDRQERMRYDRLMACGLLPVAAEMLGTADIACDIEGLKPSDHFGLLVDLDVPGPEGA